MRFIPKCPFVPFDEIYSAETRQQYFMRCAFNEALKAWHQGEIPVGAVGVVDEKIVVRAYNTVETKHDATAHSEMEIIRAIAHQRNDWRLNDVTLYVTKEPCPMCSGAIYKSRIPHVVIGVYDAAQGCIGGCIHFNHMLKLHHHVNVSLEPLQGACDELLTTFFKLRRQERTGL